MSSPRENPRITILKELSREPEAYLSGGRLAEMLGVSRVTVWKYFEQLREEGFEFEAARKRGYRLTKTPTAAHEDWIRALLDQTAYPNTSVTVLEQIDSTNSEAERWLSQGGATPHFIIAQSQTSGRGRQGAEWLSQNTGNMYLSAVFRPELLPSQMQLFTLWVGLHVARALRNFDERISIKWPNDLWIEGKKCAGMLTEARIDADRIRDLVFGLGLNVNLAPSNESLEASSLAKVGETIPVSIIASTVISAVMKAYESVADASTADCLVAMWPAYDALSGTEINMRAGAEGLMGKARGIRSDGALAIELTDGTMRYLHSGEVRQVRPSV